MSGYSKVAIAVGLIAILIGATRALPFWLTLLLTPIWLAALGLGILAISVGARWWYDETLAKHDDRRQARRRRKRPSIRWNASVHDTDVSVGYVADDDGRTTKALLRNVLRLIHQDFISPWYSRISSSPTFPNALDKTILYSVERLEDRFAKLDVPQLLVAKILPHMTSHMQAYRQVEPFLYPSTRTTSTQATVDPAPILQSHRKTPLHPALPAPALANPIPSVESHLKRKVEQLLRVVLPPEERESETVMIIAREVVTCAIAMPLVEMLADPDFWNRLLDQQADRHMQERQQVNQLRAALESAASQPSATIRQRSSMPVMASTDGASSVTTPRATRARQSASISMNTDTRSFDVFLKSISKIQNVTEAKRLRNDVEREIRQVQARLSIEPTREGTKASLKEFAAKTKQLEAYLSRLESARRKVDRKIGKLSGTSPTAGHAGQRGEDQVEALGSPLTPSLRDVLTNPSPLSFYMEFMDRRKQARLVQFWLTVESFKNPLEEVDSSDDDEQLGYSRLSSSMQHLDAAELGTICEDVSMIWSMFLDPAVVSEPVPLRNKLFESIRSGAMLDLSESSPLSPIILDQARKATFRAQRDIYSAMLEDHFPDFRKTDLYRKAVIDLNKATRKGSQMVQLGSAPLDATSRPQESAGAMLRQGSLSPVSSASPLPNTSTQSRWLNQLVGFGGSKSRGNDVDPLIPATPATARPRRALASFQARSNKADEVSSPSKLPKELPRVRSWSIGYSSRNGAVSPTPAPAPSLHALGFLIGDEATEDHNGRSALFANEDEDNALIPPDTQRFPSEHDEDYVQFQRMEAIQAALTSIIDRDDQTRGTSSVDDYRPRASMDSTMYPRPSSSLDVVDSDDRWDPLGAVPSATLSPDLGAGGRPSFGEAGSRTSMDGRNRRPLALQPALKARRMFDSSEDAPISSDLFRSSTSSSVPVLSSLEKHMSPNGTALTVLDTRLSLEIARLGELLAKLDEQDRILDQMIRTAELTGKEGELELLLRSQSDLRRELRATRFRKMQYEQQEIDYRLDSERTKLAIPNATVLAEEAGKQIVRYVVEIRQHSIEGEFLQSWAVARRYNEFWDLQHALKASPAVGPELKARNLDVPSKKLLPKLTDTFVEGRRVALERYMQGLLQIPSACGHPALKIFLSQTRLNTSASRGPATPGKTVSSGQNTDPGLTSPNLVHSLYNQVASSLDDIFLKPSMIDVMADKLNRQAVDMAEAWDAGLTQIGNYGLELGSSVLSPYALRALRTPAQDANQTEREAFPFPSIQPHTSVQGEECGRPPPTQPQAIIEETSFTTPITDFMVEVFGLKNGDWLRKQALVIVIQQLLGSTIERKVRDGIKVATCETSFGKYLAAFQDSLWEDGVRRPSTKPRTEVEKSKAKLNAGRKIQAFIPDVAANMIGRSNAQRAARQVFGAMQIRLLNLHIILTILDEIIAAILSVDK